MASGGESSEYDPIINHGYHPASSLTCTYNLNGGCKRYVDLNTKKCVVCVNPESEGKEVVSDNKVLAISCLSNAILTAGLWRYSTRSGAHF